MSTDPLISENPPTPTTPAASQGLTRKRTTFQEPKREGQDPDLNDNPRPPLPKSRKSTIMTLKRAWTLHTQPAKKVGPNPPFLQGLKAILFETWINVLLVFIPVSWALHFAKVGDVPVFVTAFLAIIPLAKLLALATDQLSIRTGQTIAGLLNATLGNAVELIVAIIAIVKCELQIVQSSLVGSILSNLLLVLGMCFFAGGLKFSEQGFGASATQINSSLLTISVIAVLLPAAFHSAVQPDPTNNEDPLTNGQEGSDILKMSHGVAIILLILYVSYLVFQLWSHTNLYDDKRTERFKSTRYPANVIKSKKKIFRLGRSEKDPETGGVLSDSAIVQSPRSAHQEISLEDEHEAMSADDDEDEEIPSMSGAMAVGLLAVVTVLVAVTAEFLVSSIDGVTDGGALSKEWVGLILLPIVGNAAEHVTAITVSVKDKLTLSIGVAVGSSIQIALFVIPFMVVLAWILGKPLLLLFDPFESVTLFLAVITVNYVVQDGKSNWLEGLVLIGLYCIIGTTFWFYKGSDIGEVLAKCT